MPMTRTPLGQFGTFFKFTAIYLRQSKSNRLNEDSMNGNHDFFQMFDSIDYLNLPSLSDRLATSSLSVVQSDIYPSIANTVHKMDGFAKVDVGFFKNVSPGKTPTRTPLCRSRWKMKKEIKFKFDKSAKMK